MGTSRFDTALKLGLTRLQTEQFSAAEGHIREALGIAPNDPEAVSLLGLTLALTDRPQQGVQLLEQAVQLDPQRARLRLNLATGLEASGELARAMGVLHTVLASDPTDLEAWIKAGDIAKRQGDLSGAIEAWNRAHDAHPGATIPIARLARTELGRGKAAEAMLILDALLKQFPGDAEILDLWCQGLTALRQWAPLEQTAVRWSSVEKSNPGAWRHLATAQMELGRPLDAAASWQTAMALSPQTADGYAALAGCYLHALDFKRAAEALRHAEAIDPELPAALSKASLLSLFYGRFVEAAELARRCLVRAPRDTTALKVLARVLRDDITETEFASIVSIAQSDAVPIDDRIAAAFAAAQVLDVRNDVDEAFAACEYAQALALERDRAEGRGYDREREETRVSRLISLVPKGPEALDPSVERTPRPIFVVGMPRSGTTLIEAVIGAHPCVFPCGERPAMRQILHAYLELDRAGAVPDRPTLAKWRAEYFAVLPEIGTAVSVTDKHPRNIEAAGLIAKLFPDARIVIVRRNPVETGLSIFRQEFSKHWNFAHRLGDIGHFHGGVARLAAHWQQVLPGRVTTIQYENFVADFERSARSLIDFCGLDWAPECLDYARSPHPIATFSSVEVRGPISDMRRADRYRDYLAPLVTALEEAGVDLESGALRE